MDRMVTNHHWTVQCVTVQCERVHWCYIALKQSCSIHWKAWHCTLHAQHTALVSTFIVWCQWLHWTVQIFTLHRVQSALHSAFQCTKQYIACTVESQLDQDSLRGTLFRHSADIPPVYRRRTAGFCPIKNQAFLSGTNVREMPEKCPWNNPTMWLRFDWCISEACRQWIWHSPTSGDGFQNLGWLCSRRTYHHVLP